MRGLQRDRAGEESVVLVMGPRPVQPYLDRLMVLRCRLSYAQQRIRELEALLASNDVEIPEATTRVPPLGHSCLPQPPG